MSAQPWVVSTLREPREGFRLSPEPPTHAAGGEASLCSRGSTERPALRPLFLGDSDREEGQKRQSLRPSRPEEGGEGEAGGRGSPPSPPPHAALRFGQAQA